ncbi:MAG: hypothetical protein WD021_01965 [Rhodothermales bacterium]
MTGASHGASFGIAVLLFAVLTGNVTAQDVDVGGRVYMDYFYQFSSPVDEQEGLHGFTYRRLYLTTDARLSNAFRARARLEANDGTSGAKGPVPFVKDLWLEWNYAGDHTGTVGVQPPPVFQLAEEVYGYRSLEKTVLDFQGINGSRDFGIRMDGPVGSGGLVRYALMLANNSGTRPESDVYKRGYGEVSIHPNEAMTFSLNADHSGYGDERSRSNRISAFGGYRADGAGVGAQLFWYELEYASGDRLRNVGASLFGRLRLNADWEVMTRVDVNRETPAAGDIDETFVLLGITYFPIENVRITPNIWLFDSETLASPDALARITVDVSF